MANFYAEKNFAKKFFENQKFLENNFKNNSENFAEFLRENLILQKNFGKKKFKNQKISKKLFQFFPQNFIRDFRVGRTPRRFHKLAHQKSENFFAPGFKFRDNFGIFRQNFFRDFFEFVRI